MLKEKRRASWTAPAEAAQMAFGELISSACQAPLAEVLDYPELLDRAHQCIHRAMQEGDPSSARELQTALYALYQSHVADPCSAFASRQFDPGLTAVRIEIENAWLARLATNAPVIDVSAAATIDTLRTLWQEHRTASHPIFDFLKEEATLAQVIHFFQSDSALNIRFFDILAYAMIGSRAVVRPELVQNFWDECGRGVPEKAHVRLFEWLMSSVGLPPNNETSELSLTESGLAGFNLFMMCALTRRHYFKLVGIMAMTELLDPSQYEKLAEGCRRVGLGGGGELEYYDEHVVIDVVHGEGWLNKVVAPLLEKTPECGKEIIAGAVFRLETCCRYYDELLIDLKSLA